MLLKRVQGAILETHLKSRETNKALKGNLRHLRARSMEINRLNVQFSRSIDIKVSEETDHGCNFISAMSTKRE